MASIPTLQQRPAASGRRRLGASLAALLRGLALVLLVLACAGLLALCAVVAYFALQPGLVTHVNAEGAYAVGSAATLLGLYLSWVLASRRKRLILFLRRFGQHSANDALSGAMYQSLGGVARLLVLDDSSFQPIAIPWRQRLLIITSVLPLLLSLALLLSFGTAVVGPVRAEAGGTSIHQQGFISIGSALPSGGDQTVYADSPALLQLPQAIPLWAAITGLAWLSLRALGAAWEARRPVADPAGLQRLLRRSRRLRWWALSPKALGTVATVASTSDAMWQQAVQTLAAEADKLVLDLSHPTDAILWELALCVDQHAHKLLLVMHASDNALQQPGALDAARLARLASLVARSADQAVLLYDLADPVRRRQFHHDLQAFVLA